MELTQGNETIAVELETSGMTYEEYIADPTGATFDTICAESADMKIEKDTDERNPLCVKGKVTVITSKTMTISLSGAVDVSNPALEYLHTNLIDVDNVLLKITDTLFPDAPKEYIAWCSVTDNSYPREGGSTVEFSIECSSGQYEDITPVTPAPAPIA